MSDIEEFLKRAAQRRRQSQPRPVVEIIEPVLDAEIVEAEAVDGADVSQHVAEHLDSSKFSRRSASMGQRVGLADDHMEAHLQEKFEHDVGRLAQKPASPEVRTTAKTLDKTTSEPPPAAAQQEQHELFKMLCQPQGIRQAVILSEILQRPVDRW